jgi:hypothetical protein
MEQFMQLKAKKDFSWAHKGCVVEHFKAGQVIESDDSELVSVSVREGWAEEVKAHKHAPENKACESQEPTADAQKQRGRPKKHP